MACLVAWQAAAQQTAPVAFINEIHNEPSQAREFTEIIVAQDGLDLRNHYLGDNNGATDSWQPKVRFTDAALWANLRAGTYIIVYHATNPADCQAIRPDEDAADGFLRVCAQNTRLFERGNTSQSLNLNSAGDFLQLVAPNGAMIQGLGYDPSPGSSVVGGPCFNTSTRWTNVNGTEDDVRPCGRFLFMEESLDNSRSLGYIGGTLPGLIPSPGTLYTDSNAGTLLNYVRPSEGHGNQPLSGPGTANIDLIKQLRQPAWPLAATACITLVNGRPSFTFTPATDPTPADGITRYLIVRYPAAPLATDPPPADGITYRAGEALGSGTVVEPGLARLTGTSYTYRDAAGLPNSQYRVYAYRYTDANSADDRGSAYNETQFVQASPGAQPFLTGNPTRLCPGDTARFALIYNGPEPLALSASLPGVTVGRSGVVVTVTADTSVRSGDTVTILAIPAVQSLCARPDSIRIGLFKPELQIVGDTIVPAGGSGEIRVVAGRGPFDITPPNQLLVRDSATYVFINAVPGTTYTFRTREQANSTRCLAQASLTLRERPVPPTVPLLIPNVVVPAGLPNNRTFRIQGAVVDRLEIFGRWGNRVLEAAPYTNDWAGKPGVYFYTANLTLPNGQTQTAKGWVEVVQ